MGLRVSEATRDQAAALAGLTWGAYAPLLSWSEDEKRRSRAVSLAVWAGTVPVGLSVSVKGAGGGQNLLSLTVAPAWRRRGVGRLVLRTTTETLIRRGGVTALEACFSDRLPGFDGFTALLAAEGWQAPEPTSHRICGPVRETFSVFRHRAGIIERLNREGFRILTWAEAGMAALAKVAELEATGEAPAWASPRHWLEKLHPEASMVLVDADGDVRGWVVCQHQEAMNRWYFPVGWVRQPQASRGWLLGAYAEGARRLGERHGQDTRVVVESGAGQPDMVRVLERHFRPHADWADRLMVSWRKLS